MDNYSEDPALSYLSRRIAFGSRLTAILNLYIGLGGAMVVGGIGYLAYSKLNIALSDKEQLALGATVLGALLGILSFIAISYRKIALERDKERYEQYASAARFIEAWNTFEQAGKHAAFGNEKDGQLRSLRETIYALRTEGKITASEALELEELLRIRNSVVHGSGAAVGATVIRDALERLLGFVTKFV